MNNVTTFLTVSQLNARARQLLESEMGVLWLIGEISNFSAPSSGHWYFTLKDNHSQVKCAMFKGKNHFVHFQPINGNQVLARARISLYEPRGDFQIIIESMQPNGDGLLQQKFEHLKAGLAFEGLFSTADKMPLPLHPRRIGIITSKTGAALYDILNILKRRDPSLAVVIYPTQVQGKSAAAQIVQMIEIANTRKECDVLIIGRGGGSLEDLWCFNEEIVARAIYASNIATISAVGHEVDVTISDYVADVRAPTPSAAAELVSQDSAYKAQQLSTKFTALQRSIDNRLAIAYEQAKALNHKLALLDPKYKFQQQTQRFDDVERRLFQGILSNVEKEQYRLTSYINKLASLAPNQRIASYNNNLHLLWQRLSDAAQKILARNEHQFLVKVKTLNAVSPLSTMHRGYSITQNSEEKVIHSIDQVNAGQSLSTVLTDGIIYSTVDRISKTAFDMNNDE